VPVVQAISTDDELSIRNWSSHNINIGKIGKQLAGFVVHKRRYSDHLLQHLMPLDHVVGMVSRLGLFYELGTLNSEVGNCRKVIVYSGEQDWLRFDSV
jgi:hypothetical protein